MKLYLFVFNLAKFGAFFALFGLFGAIFGVGIRFKNTIVTYLHRQSTLVLKVQPYLFVFNLATFGVTFALFWALRNYFLALWGLVGVRFKNNFGTYLCIKSTLVLEIQPYLIVFNLAKFGAFLTFFGPFEAIFGVWVKLMKFFETYLHRLTTFILEV